MPSSARVLLTLRTALFKWTTEVEEFLTEVLMGERRGPVAILVKPLLVACMKVFKMLITLERVVLSSLAGRKVRISYEGKRLFVVLLVIIICGVILALLLPRLGRY